jgi:hypothetical protein
MLGVGDRVHKIGAGFCDGSKTFLVLLHLPLPSTISHVPHPPSTPICSLLLCSPSLTGVSSIVAYGAVSLGKNRYSLVIDGGFAEGTEYRDKLRCEGAAADCYDAYLPNHSCLGYEEIGYTCVGDYCAALDPFGTPETCAVRRPEGYVVDPQSGRCVLDPNIQRSCKPVGDARAAMLRQDLAAGRYCRFPSRLFDSLLNLCFRRTRLCVTTARTVYRSQGLRPG